MKLAEIKEQIRTYAEQENAIAYPLWIMVAGIHKIINLLEGYTLRRIDIKVPRVSLSVAWKKPQGLYRHDAIREAGVCPDCDQQVICAETCEGERSYFRVKCACPDEEIVDGFFPPLQGIQQGKPLLQLLAENEQRLIETGS